MNITQNWLEKFKTLLLSLIIFTIPINLFWKIDLSSAYVNGFLVDYLIPKFYLVEIFLLAFFIFEIFVLRNKLSIKVKEIIKKENLIITALLLVFIARQIFTNNPTAAFNHLFHIFEAILLFYFLRIDNFFEKKENKKLILRAMLVTIIFQSSLAYYQFIFQKPLFTYHILGESNLLDFANISKGFFFNQEKILPYASTAHPNILAGIISIFSLLIWKNKKRVSLEKTFLLINWFLIVFFTQSITAFMTIFLYPIYLLSQKSQRREIFTLFFYYLFFILLPFIMLKVEFDFINPDSILRRNILNKAAFEIFRNWQIFGVGINNFSTVLESFSQNREVIRFIQPAHHILLLILSEGGLILISLILLIKDRLRSEMFWQKALILLAIASLDHYLITQVSGLNTLALFFYLI